MALKPNIKRILLQKELDGEKITQVELAKRLDVTPQQFSLWVKGESYPRANTLFKLAYELGVKVDDLYDYED